MKKRKMAILLCLAVLGLGTVGWWKLRPESAEATSLSGAAVPVKRGPLRQTVGCTGRIVPNLSVEIKCKASGQVVKLPFDVSDLVHAGDLMIEIDPIEQTRNVQKAEAALKASRARLAQSQASLVVAERNLQAGRQQSEAAILSSEARAKDARAKAWREKELLAKTYSSEEEAETAETTAAQAEQDVTTARASFEKVKAQEAELDVARQDVSVNRAQTESDEINLSLAQQYLSETKVMAPIDGVVSAKDIQIGQIISSGISNIGGGTTAMTLADMSHLFVLASVDETQIGLVRVGQPVEITVDAFPKEQFSGKVMRIANTGENVSNVVTFEVKIEILSENKALLKPEMTANVDIIVSEKADVLHVPMAAVSRTREGAFVNVQAPDGAVQERKPVEIGISDGTDIEIVNGLDEKDTVLLKSSTESANRNKGMPPPPPMMVMPMAPSFGYAR